MKKFFDWIRPYVEKPWFLPFACALAFIDLFVLFIPTEALIIIPTMLRPKRWWFYGTVIAISSCLGALTLGTLAYHYGEPFVIWLLGPKFFESSNWIRMNGWIEKYGFGGLWFISIGPLPQQPAILIGALAKMPLVSIFFAVLFGRLPKYLLFAYLSQNGSTVLEKIFGEEMKEVKQTVAEVSQHENEKRLKSEDIRDQ